MIAGISTRWKPGHVERRDTGTGRYESVNSRIEMPCEINIQRVLLGPDEPEQISIFSNAAAWLRGLFTRG